MYELLNGIEEKTKHTKNYISHITNVLCFKTYSNDFNV